MHVVYEIKTPRTFKGHKALEPQNTTWSLRRSDSDVDP